MILTDAIKNSMAQVIATAANNGYLRAYSSGAVLLAESRFASTAFGSPSAGAIAANTITASPAVANGDIASMKMLQSDGATEIATLTVGVGSGDVKLSRLDVRVGEPVQINSCVLSVT